MIRLIRLALATFRLALLISKEEGPAMIFVKLRAKAGAYNVGPSGIPTTNLGRGVSCPYCVGVYAAVFFLVLEAIPFGDRITDFFAVAGLQSLFQSLSEGLQDGGNE